MSTLLHIDSSPRGDASVSHALTQEFEKNWLSSHVDGKVIRRDLTNSGLTAIDGSWIGAAFTPEESRTAEQKDILKLSDELVGELVAADELVIGVPMHNFSVPGVFKLYIDQIARVGKTFTYANGVPQGLLTGKKATFLIATGGQYGPGSAAASFNFVEPYLRTFFGFIGVTDTTFITAGGAAALNYGADREQFLLPHVEAVRAHFA
jgi:FMN-dependent NADH-azoreductase